MASDCSWLMHSLVGGPQGYLLICPDVPPSQEGSGFDDELFFYFFFLFFLSLFFFFLHFLENKPFDYKE
jgi:hypothetical protein